MARRNFVMLKNNDYFIDNYDFLHSDRKGRISDFSLFSHSKNKNSSLNDSRLLSEADTAVSLLHPTMSHNQSAINDHFFEPQDDILQHTTNQPHHHHSQHHNIEEHHCSKASRQDYDGTSDAQSSYDGDDCKDPKDRTNRDEVRKRKRKSNQQLKILKWEFEKDGFWDKEKILNVAKITGLSES